MDYEKIGEFIKEKRKRQNLTQKELAEKIKVTDKAISKWERGQGCPDVSILEVLSKELDCSVLELLKGREIKNEVIPVIEADDYIKESMTLQKEKSQTNINNILNKIIETIIIFMVLLLGYLNITQILYIDKEKEYIVSRSYYKNYKELTDDIEKNLKIIEDNKGIYKEEDYENIKKELEDGYVKIQASKIYQIIMDYKEVNYTIHDLIMIQETTYLAENTHNIIEILETYSNKDFIKDFRKISRSLQDGYNLEPYMSYKYRLSYLPDYGDYMFSTEDRVFFESFNTEYGKLTELLYLTELVKEVGDIHE